jgi:hypothetical protein
VEISPAIVDDAKVILALQRLAYQTEAAVYDDFTLVFMEKTIFTHHSPLTNHD